MTLRRKYVQGVKYRLYGSGISSTDTSVRLTSMTLPNSGEPVTMTMFGEKGYATIEPGNFSREENISFTGLTQNIDGSATLTGVTRGLKLATETETYEQVLALRKSHAGGVVIAITNSAPFYSDVANKFNDETIVGKYTFPSTAGVDRPVISADTNAVLNEELITKGEVNRLLAAEFLTPTVVTSSSATTGNSADVNLEWSHVSSGSNRLLLVQVVTEEDKTVSGITYNGDALTQAVFETRATGDLRTEIWYLVAPDLGTNQIEITMSYAAYISATAITLDSVNQAAPIGGTASDNDDSANPLVTVTTVQENSILVDAVGTADDPMSFTAGTVQSIQQEITDTAARQIATSVKESTSTGNYTMEYTINPSTDWAMASVEVKGIVTGGGGGGGVQSVTSSDSIIDVDNTDPENPVLSLDVVELANDTTFINELTDNATFQSNVNAFVTGGGGGGNISEQFDDFINKVILEDGSDSYEVSGNFIVPTGDSATFSTEPDHPGIITLNGAVNEIVGFGNLSKTGSNPDFNLLNFADDFDITILTRATWTATAGETVRWNYILGGLTDYIEIEFAQALGVQTIKYDIGAGLVTSVATFPTSGDWYTLRFRMVSGTLTATIDGETIYTGTPSFTDNFGVKIAVLQESGTSDIDLAIDYVRTNYRDISSGGTNIEEFTADGTWTKPAGLKFIEVELWGAGGAGAGGVSAAGIGASRGGAGGGGGAYVRKIIQEAELGSTESVTVGLGGAGGAGGLAGGNNGANGGNGGHSSFGSLAFAGGGGGGTGGGAIERLGGGGGGSGTSAVLDSPGAPYAFSHHGVGGAGAYSASISEIGFGEFGGGAGGTSDSGTSPFRAEGGSSLYGGAGGGAGGSGSGVGSGDGADGGTVNTWQIGGGASGGALNTSGANGTNFGEGGGGGGSGSTAGNGGNGATAAGGGGGGRGDSSTAGGDGGDGGDGLVRVTEYF